MSGKILPVSRRATSARMDNDGTSPEISSPATIRIRKPIGSASALIRSRKEACIDTKASSTTRDFFLAATFLGTTPRRANRQT